MITINDKDYTFKFGFKAMVKFEETTGVSFADIGEKMPVKHIADLCYCGIVEPEITREEIVNALDDDFSLVGKVSELVSKEMVASQGLKVEAKK